MISISRFKWLNYLWVLVFSMLVVVSHPAVIAAEQDQVKLDTFEQSIGEQAAEQVIQQYGGEYFLPFEQHLVVDEIFQRLVAVAERRDVNYTLTILNTPVVNAFALPGGYVFLTRGLLQLMDSNPQAVAAILGHEIVHVEKRHGVQALARQMGLTLLIELGLIFFDLYNHEAVRTAGAVVVEMAQSGWSREAEFEADALGMDLAVEAGFDPMGPVYAMDFLRQLEPGELPLAWFRSHPDEEARQARLQEQAASYWTPKVGEAWRTTPEARMTLVQDPLGRYQLSLDDSASAATLEIWDAQLEQPRTWAEHLTDVSAAHWNPDGQYLAVAGRDDSGRRGIWLLDRYGRGRDPWRLPVEGTVTALAWESSGARLAYVLADATGSSIQLAYVKGRTDVPAAVLNHVPDIIVWEPDGLSWTGESRDQWHGVSIPSLQPVQPPYPVPRVIEPDFRSRPEVTVEGTDDTTIFRIRRPNILLP